MKPPVQYPQEFLSFIDLFNRGKFFEAHEVLEFRWRQEKGEILNFYRGLIQIAAVFVHLRKGTPAGGRELFKKATKLLEKFRPNFMGVNLEGLLNQTQICLETVNAPLPKI